MNDFTGELSEFTNIKKIISDKKIRWLCHFTPRCNLESIKEKGLIPRDFLPENILFTDSLRFDKHNNAICLSISKPNQWMFKKKQKEGFDLCLILIDPDVLFKKCFFFQHNAATKSYRYMNDNDFKGSSALKSLFDNEISYQKSGEPVKTIYRNDKYNISETTSDQAEIQFLETIEPHYIKYIFETNIPLTYNEIVIEVNKLNKKSESNYQHKKIINNKNEDKIAKNYIEMMSKFSMKYSVYNKNESKKVNSENKKRVNEDKIPLKLTEVDNYIKIVNNIKLKEDINDEKIINPNKVKSDKFKIRDLCLLVFIVIAIIYLL